jgi:hypothetical protein
MNRSTFASRTRAQHPLAELHEHERANAETSRDPLARFIIALDLRVRRLAHRVADWVQASRRTPPSRVS